MSLKKKSRKISHEPLLPICPFDLKKATSTRIQFAVCRPAGGAAVTSLESPDGADNVSQTPRQNIINMY